jgi:hypothetical protein
MYAPQGGPLIVGPKSVSQLCGREGHRVNYRYPRVPSDAVLDTPLPDYHRRILRARRHASRRENVFLTENQHWTKRDARRGTFFRCGIEARYGFTFLYLLRILILFFSHN